MDVADLLKAMQFTLRAPRQGARMVMDWQLGTRDGWLALALFAIISTLLAKFLMTLVPDGAEPQMAALLNNPFEFAALQFAGLGIVALALLGVGRLAGGRGSLAETLSVIGWLQAILLLIQFAEILSLMILPLLTFFIGIAGLVMSLWLFTNFTAELHGFRSLWRTFAGIIATFIVLVVALSLILIFVFGIGV
ncbi:MAG: Yip1 family protein [bacterium]